MTQGSAVATRNINGVNLARLEVIDRFLEKCKRARENYERLAEDSLDWRLRAERKDPRAMDSGRVTLSKSTRKTAHGFSHSPRRPLFTRDGHRNSDFYLMKMDGLLELAEELVSHDSARTEPIVRRVGPLDIRSVGRQFDNVEDFADFRWGEVDKMPLADWERARDWLERIGQALRRDIVINRPYSNEPIIYDRNQAQYDAIASHPAGAKGGPSAVLKSSNTAGVQALANFSDRIETAIAEGQRELKSQLAKLGAKGSRQARQAWDQGEAASGHRDRALKARRHLPTVIGTGLAATFGAVVTVATHGIAPELLAIGAGAVAIADGAYVAATNWTGRFARIAPQASDCPENKAGVRAA